MTRSFPLTLQAVNGLSAEAFLEAFGDVAEHSPWVAAAAERERPFASRDQFVAVFEDVLREATDEDRLALIRAHPDLAGKAAMAGAVAEDSQREQAGAGLNRLSAEEFARFTALNDRYREQFGFPFIFAVKGATKDMILAAFEARVENDPETEFQTAVTQVARIFRFRIEDRVLP